MKQLGYIENYNIISLTHNIDILKIAFVFRQPVFNFNLNVVLYESTLINFIHTSHVNPPKMYCCFIKFYRIYKKNV